ncbi:MAG: glycosyl hydrolase family 28-related protein [Planctomycetota bacterium]
MRAKHVSTAFRRFLMGSVTLGAALGGGSASAQLSESWLSYAANPDAHPNIPNVSYAGYAGGGVPLPDGVGNTVVSVADFGAVGDGVTDDTAAVRSALIIAGISATPRATLYFPAGTYRLSRPLLVYRDGVDIRGDGPGASVLLFAESLQSSYAVYPGDDPGDSLWSFTGGMIWFTDSSRDPDYAGVPTISSATGGWSLTNTRDITSGGVLGDRVLTVSSTSGYSVGDEIVVEIDNAGDLSTLRHLLGDGAWANNYMFVASRDGNIMPPSLSSTGTSSFRAYHTIEAINGNQVTLREPLRFDARPGWDPEIRRPTVLRREVGVADLTIQFLRDYEYTDDLHGKEPGFNGIYFNDTINGFVDNVHVIDCGALGVFVQRSKNITVSGLVIDATGADREYHHHGVGYANSTDCLMEEIEIRSRPRHGLYVGNFSVNNVFSRATMQAGTFDYHRRLPYANVYTEIDIVNNGRAGGNAASGPEMGARHAHWNVTTNNTGSLLIAQPDIMPMGSLVGVRTTTPTSPIDAENGDSEAILESAGYGAAAPNPRNLYEAQLALRFAQPIDDGPGVPDAPPCPGSMPYDFSFGGIEGAALIGQDNWVFERDFTETDGNNVRLETEPTPAGPVLAAVSTNGYDSVISRQNTGGFGFVPHRATQTEASISFEGRAGISGGSSGNAYLILNNTSGNDGIQFGMSASQFLIRGGQFSGVLQTFASIPSGWYSRGEWFRIELRIDFTANGGEGAGSLFFLNLTDGDTEYRAVPGLQNVPFEGEVRFPETWDRIEFRIRNEAAATNIVANANPSSCCPADLDGDGQLTPLADVVPFVAMVAAADPLADIDGAPGTDLFDLLAHLALVDAGCP